MPRELPFPLLQSHKATWDHTEARAPLQTPGPALWYTASPTAVAADTKPRPPALQGDKPVQVLDTAGSLQFPLSTISSHAWAPLFHAQARNLGISQVLLPFVLVMSICRCKLNSFRAQRLPKSPHHSAVLVALSERLSQFISNCRIARGRAHGMGHAH